MIYTSWKPETKNSLNLVGDGDDLDLIEAIEASFDVSFGDDELRDVRTFGELYDAVVSHLAHTEDVRRTHCRSATAFRKIRRAFQLTGLGEIRPSTPLRSLLATANHGKLSRRLEYETGLDLRATTLAGWTLVIGSCVATAASLSFLSLTGSTLDVPTAFGTVVATTVGGMFLAVVAASVSNGWGMTFDRDLLTAGDLADRAVHLNFKRLSSPSGQNHPADVWRTLEWISRDISGCKRRIDRDTRLIY
jgi:hypothetical protein